LTFQVLKHNIRLNKLKNVLAIQTALGKEDGFAYLETGKHYERCRLSKTKGILVKVRSLDNLIGELEIGKVDWLKIDAEGMELDILRGAERILVKYNPKLIIEIRENKGEILGFLKERDFRVEEIDDRHLFSFRERAPLHK
jgi:FkbM family methyltransferase